MSVGDPTTGDVRVSVVLDCRDPARLAVFWSAALGYDKVGEGGAFIVLAAREKAASRPVLILQQVAEPKAGKNRMHLDLHPPLDHGVPAYLDKLEELGARRLGDPVMELWETSRIWWVTMADPEGNEFDVVADEGHPPPPPGG